MIDNFALQPYPLEASTDGGDTWRLVIGWRQDPTGQLAPVVAWQGGGLSKLDDPSSQLRYRQAAPPTSTLRVSPTAAPSHTAEAIRTEARAVAPRRRPDPA